MGLETNICMFIDCNCLTTSTPGGGPAEGGPEAIRWSDTVQRAFYNGWKSVHGLKHQTCDNAWGITVDMAGPTSLRRNDSTVLRLSNINNRMAFMQEGADEQLVIFGDSAYAPETHIRSYFKVIELVQNYQEWNRKMKSVRISIEWNYGFTAAMWQYVGHKEKLKVLKGDFVTHVYTVCTILRNCYVGLYGGQSSVYFDVSMPDDFIDHYITQTNWD
jgi:hypothetical protein